MNKEYWNNKEQRSIKARHHTRLMQSSFPQQILDCINSSKVYGEYDIFPDLGYDCFKGEIEVLDMSTSEAAFYATGKGCQKIALLNFASFKNPGGKFLEGSIAQEESLCHASFLYNVLRYFDGSFYAHNRKNTNRSMYLNRAIYSPNVIFYDEIQGLAPFDVITCAAPNIGAGNKYYGVNDIENKNILLSRCKYILDIAQQNEVKTLILGAFGCGVFRQNPYTVAETFKYLLSRNAYTFQKIIFAIPNKGHGVENYKAFVNVMK